MSNNKSDKEKFAERLFNSVKNNFDKSEFGQYYNNDLLPSLANYNRADTVNMNEQEMNQFRHIAGTKQALNDLGSFLGTFYSLGKEVKDTFMGYKPEDTLFDLKNDLRAYKLHLQQPQLRDTELYNYVFDKYIKPKRTKGVGNYETGK